MHHPPFSENDNLLYCGIFDEQKSLTHINMNRYYSRYSWSYFQIKGVTSLKRRFSLAKFELTFDQSVVVTKTFYPSISVSKMFADLGGALGLWLGVGIIQMFALGVTFFGYCFSKSNLKQRK